MESIFALAKCAWLQQYRRQEPERQARLGIQLSSSFLCCIDWGVYSCSKGIWWKWHGGDNNKEAAMTYNGG
ncbi:DUF4166 domain-containing protein [Sesbania bispinosa]|nr:DUF4166 domain-containing protein [Sesbania bispinosa]